MYESQKKNMFLGECDEIALGRGMYMDCKLSLTSPSTFVQYVSQHESREQEHTYINENKRVEDQT